MPKTGLVGTPLVLCVVAVSRDSYFVRSITTHDDCLRIIIIVSLLTIMCLSWTRPLTRHRNFIWYFYEGSVCRCLRLSPFQQRQLRTCIVVWWKPVWFFFCDENCRALYFSWNFLLGSWPIFHIFGFSAPCQLKSFLNNIQHEVPPILHPTWWWVPSTKIVQNLLASLETKN